MVHGWLMKLLHYLDFDHFEKYGTSVTGETYLRWQADHPLRARL